MKVIYLTVDELDVPLTYLKIEDTWQVTIRNFGRADYSWKIDGRKEDVQVCELHNWLKDYEDKDGFYSAEALGLGLSWVSERTFAHVIVDVLRNI